MTYYKYQPNSPSDFTNWSKISTELTSYIDELQKKQEAKSEKAKKEAQEAEDRALSREASKLSIETSQYNLAEKKREKDEARELASLTAQSSLKSSVPTLADLQTMNQRAIAKDASNPNVATAFATGVGNAAAEQLAILQRQYKSGEITAAALTVGQNNLVKNTAQLFTAMKGFNDWQNKTSQGILDGKVSDFGAFVAEQYEGVANNLDKLAVQFTPEGNMYFAKQGQDPNAPLISSTDIFMMPALQYAPFSVSDFALGFNKAVNDTYKKLTASGATLTDPTKRPGYQDFEKREIDVVLGDPIKVASILTDNEESGYKFVMDDGTGAQKSGSDGKTIPVIQTKDGLRPVIDKHHIDKARSILQNAITQGMPIAQSKGPEPKEDPNKLTATESQALDKARSLYSGNNAAFNTAVSGLKLPPGTTVKRIGNGIEVTTSKVVGGKTVVDKTSYTGDDFAQFVKAVSGFAGSNSLAAPEKAKYYGGANVGGEVSASSSTQAALPPDDSTHDAAVAAINTATDDGFDTKDAAKARKAIDQYISQVNSNYGTKYSFSIKGSLATISDKGSGMAYSFKIVSGSNIGQQYANALKALNAKVKTKLEQ